MDSSTDVLYQGWMRKQQTVTRLWHNRYFLLLEDRLTHQHNYKDDNSSKTTFLLRLVDSVIKSETITNAIDITLSDVKGVVTLRVDDTDDFKSWFYQLNQQVMNSKLKLDSNIGSITAGSSSNGSSTDNDITQQPLNKSGYLLKKSNNKYTLAMQERYVCIDKHCMKYYKKKSDKVCVGSINLQHADAPRLYDINPKCKTFEVHNDGRVYVFAAKDNLEAREWIVAIEQARVIAKDTLEQSNFALHVAELPDAVRIFDTYGTDHYLRHLSDEIGSLYTIAGIESSMTLQEHLECCEGISEYVIILNTDTSQCKPVRNDVLQMSLKYINNLLNERLESIIQIDSPMIVDASLGDIHLLITWIARYRDILLHIYCPSPQSSNMQIHGFILHKYINSLCDRYVYGSTGDGTGGALGHLQIHCSKVWDNILSKKTDMIQRHKDGSFYTYGPTDIWEVLNQHLSLGVESGIKVLHALLIEVIAAALSGVVNQITTYVKSLDMRNKLLLEPATSGTVDTVGSSNDSDELEFLCALANDNAKHIDEVVDVVKSFEYEDLRSNVSSTFDAVSKELITCGEACISQLVGIVMADIKDNMDAVFTDRWLEYPCLDVILATIDDYLNDFKEFLMPYWYEKMVSMVMERAVAQYVHSILYHGMDEVPAHITRMLSRAMERAMKSNNQVTYAEGTSTSTSTASSMYAATSSLSMVAGTMSVLKTNPMNYFTRRRGSRAKPPPLPSSPSVDPIATSSNGIGTLVSGVSNRLKQMSSSTASSILPHIRQQQTTCDINNATHEVLFKDIRDMKDFFLRVTNGDSHAVEEEVLLLSEVCSHLYMPIDELHTHAAQLILKVPLHSKYYLYVLITCLYLKKYSDDNILSIVLELIPCYMQSLEMVHSQPPGSAMGDKIGYKFQSICSCNSSVSTINASTDGSSSASSIGSRLRSITKGLLTNSHSVNNTPHANNTSSSSGSSGSSGNGTPISTVKMGNSKLANDVARLETDRVDELMAVVLEADMLQQKELQMKQQALHLEGMMEKKNNKGIWQSRWFKVMTKQNITTDPVTSAVTIASLTYMFTWSKSQKTNSLNAIDAGQIVGIRITSAPRLLSYNSIDNQMVLESVIKSNRFTSSSSDWSTLVPNTDSSTSSSSSSSEGTYFSFLIETKDSKSYLLRTDVVDTFNKWVVTLIKASNTVFSKQRNQWVTKAEAKKYNISLSDAVACSSVIATLPYKYTQQQYRRRQLAVAFMNKRRLRHHTNSSYVTTADHASNDDDDDDDDECVDDCSSSISSRSNCIYNGMSREHVLEIASSFQTLAKYASSLQRYDYRGRVSAAVCWDDVKIMKELSKENYNYCIYYT